MDHSSPPISVGEIIYSCHQEHDIWTETWNYFYGLQCYVPKFCPTVYRNKDFLVIHHSVQIAPTAICDYNGEHHKNQQGLENIDQDDGMILSVHWVSSIRRRRMTIPNSR